MDHSNEEGSYSDDGNLDSVLSDVEDLAILLYAREQAFQGTSYIPLTRYRPKSYRGLQIVEECFTNDSRCKQMTRMNSACLRELLRVFVEDYGVSTPGYTVPLEEQLTMTLNYLATGTSMSSVAGYFDHSAHTVWRSLTNMVGPLCRLFVDEVRPVDQSVVHRKLREHPIRSAFHVGLSTCCFCIMYMII